MELLMQKVKKHWTDDRLKKLTAGHNYHILPTNAPVLLKTVGLLNNDGTMSADATRKYIQINHLFNLFKPHLEELNSRHEKLRILDAGCGSAFLTFLLGWAYKDLWKHRAAIYGVDSNQSLIKKNETSSVGMFVDDILKFFVSSIQDISWQDLLSKSGEIDDFDSKKHRPHVVVALHACDTATDDAIAFGIKNKSDFIAVAPCCQAELARKWKNFNDLNVKNPLKPAFQNPHLRREIATHFTDLARVLILRGHGYEVTTTEFTMSHATPKNTLIMATRRGNYHLDAQSEYKDFISWSGGIEISLASKVAF